MRCCGESAWTVLAMLLIGAAPMGTPVLAQQPSTNAFAGPNCFSTVIDEVQGRAGTVLASRDQPQMIFGVLDVVYVEADGDPLEEGAEYLLYREETALRHPVTDAPLGAVINLLGRARILDSEGARAMAEISYACAEIEPGDRLHVALPATTSSRAPATAYDPHQLITTNDADALVVFGQGETVRLPGSDNERGSLNTRAMYGIGDVITIDQGSVDGWQIDMTALLYRPPGPMARGLEPSTEATVLGHGVVFWVETTTAAIMITGGDRVIEVGARARPGQ